MTDRDGELQRFLAGECDPAAFGHDAHVAMAGPCWTGTIFSRRPVFTIAPSPASPSAPASREKRSLTRTLAFLSLIAETGQDPGRHALEAWYSPQRLAEPRGRDSFLMPDRFCG